MAVQINTETEAYAAAREQETAEWYKKYAGEEQAHLKRIDELLCQGGEAARNELLDMLCTEKTEVYRYRSNPLMGMIAIMDIYRMEIAAGEISTILDMTHEGCFLDREGLIKRVRQLRFLMWRKEFAQDEAAGEQLVLYIKENKVSPFFLCKAIDTMAGNKLKMLGEVMELVLDAGMLRHTYWLLRAIETRMPEEESIRAMRAQIEMLCGMEK